ncbi:hypothetical protein [Pseudonocardia sp.]|uniref:hypothetical protein n=1 Tax=Pseudonocardia sp. TaxID=60912 RepID=UPI0031FD2156
MEPPRPTPPPWLPAARPQVPPPAVPDPLPTPPPAPPARPRFDWRRLTRSPRGAVGLAITAAALLLWPFSGLSWIPWLVGLGALVVLRILRLDGLLRGWDLHIAGLVVVVGLMMSTSPWAWALAASIGVLLAGLAQLPWWRLAAVGAVLCLVSGLAFAWANVRDAQEAAASYGMLQQESKADQGAPRPQSVLPLLLNRIALGSPGAICDNLLAEPARTQFAASVGQPDCTAAVMALAARVSDPVRYAQADVTTTPTATGLEVDACSMDWGSRAPAGPQVGHLTIGAVAPSRYVVTGFRPC